ncbi:hypothetical protein LguiB_003938 [Lonicera macranthoides]
MRAGGFTIQQALTPDAASIIKQAVTLARRRGHAQVTPLHVAHTMLSASPGLLRTACLQSQSHSHPLQCKALELCFNVALNRLPASSSVGPPMLGPQNNSYSTQPSISNALVAAFKRAQAHQRRGSIESQQQPLLAVKIELEQLIISILDDPSVSRVMREAGFSSTQVKSNVEQAQAQSSSTNPQSKPKSEVNEDVMRVIENLMGKKRKNLVIVGECLDTIEGVVRGVMSNEGLREVKFIRIPLSSLGHLSRGEREQKLGELKCLVKDFLEKGVVLYLGDLEWVIENRTASGGGSQGRSYNSPVEETIDELGKLACVGGERGRNIWILGIASFKTYMKCRNGYPSLESVWGLHAITIPAGSLALSLIPESDVQSDTQNKKAGNGSTSWLFHDHQDKHNLTCCVDCSANFNTEARTTRTATTFTGDSSSSSLPLWLKDETKRLNSNNDQDCVSVKELCKKWNSFCSSTHKQALTFTSVSPSSSTSCFSFDRQNPYSIRTHQNWPAFEPKTSCRDHNFWSSIPIDKPCETSLRMYITLENPNSTPNSASSSDVMETEYVQRFKEFNAENLKTLCNALEKKVPWHKDIVPEIAGTVLQCRSGMLRRREKIKVSDNIQAKEETWFVFQGVDVQAKEKIARELAKAVFGSHSSFVSIALSTFSSTRADSSEDLRNKRSRDEKSCSYIERLGEEVLVNPHRVFFVEDVEQADYCSQMGIKRAIERGVIVKYNGEEVSLSDAIVILSCESFSSRSRACSPPIKQKLDEEEKGCELMEETNPNCVSLDLNMCFDEEEDQSIDDIGLLECVDRCIIFKIQEL